MNWMMRLTIGIVSSLILFGLCSCGEDEHPDGSLQFEEYTYVNNTELRLTLEYFSFDIKQVKIIPRGDSIIQKISIPGGSVDLIAMSDSAKVRFDDEKVYTVYSEDSNTYNFLNKDNYEYQRTDNTHQFKYTFTEEDYQRAE